MIKITLDLGNHEKEFVERLIYLIDNEVGYIRSEMAFKKKHYDKKNDTLIRDLELFALILKHFKQLNSVRWLIAFKEKANVYINYEIIQ